jgi:hypothetical protein
MTTCECETISQHDQSPGLVADDERVCRGAFAPIHYNKSGIKAGFIRPAHLLAGELSVWRIDRNQQFGLTGAREAIGATRQTDHTLEELLAASAQRIRQLEVRDEEDVPGRRAFCVVDDCSTTAEGDWHPEHAAIRMAEYDDFQWLDGSDEFTTAKELLFAVFKQSVVWKASAAT